jgi:hypothetical protein
MKKIIFLTFCLLTVAVTKAQIMAGGMVRHHVLSSEVESISNNGLEWSNTHYLYTFYANLSMGHDEHVRLLSRSVGLDITPLGFHHAYLLNNLSPFVGFQINKNNLFRAIHPEEAFPNSSHNTRYAMNVGFKYSYNRFITSVGYVMGKNERSIALKCSYVIYANSKCLRKRMTMRNMNMAF